MSDIDVPKTAPQDRLGEPASYHLRAQELYDATTVLLAVLTFTHCTEDLLKPELDEAIRRVIYARVGMRAVGIVDRAAIAIQHAEPPHGFGRDSQRSSADG